MLPQGLSCIGPRAFADTCNLEEITLPSGLETIGEGAFYYCLNLEYAYFHGDVPETWGVNVFGYTHNDFTIYYCNQSINRQRRDDYCIFKKM